MKKIAIGLLMTVGAASVALMSRDRFPTSGSASSRQPVIETHDAGSASTRSPAVDEASDEASGAPADSPVEAASPAPAAPARVPEADAEQEASDPIDEVADTADPDAETILTRASEAYERVRTLRADFTQRLDNALLGSETTSRGTLYQRRPDRFLMRFTEPEGDVIVGDGQYFWIYYPSVDEEQVIRTPMGEAGAGGVDLQAQFLGDPLERFDVSSRGKETVDGREAYVLELEPLEASVTYRRLTAWIDTEDYLVRRFTIEQDNGTTRHIRLRNLEVNEALDDGLFEFTPPPGAQVIDRG